MYLNLFFLSFVFFLFLLHSHNLYIAAEDSFELIKVNLAILICVMRGKHLIYLFRGFHQTYAIQCLFQTITSNSLQLGILVIVEKNPHFFFRNDLLGLDSRSQKLIIVEEIITSTIGRLNHLLHLVCRQVYFQASLLQVFYADQTIRIFVKSFELLP